LYSWEPEVIFKGIFILSVEIFILSVLRNKQGKVEFQAFKQRDDVFFKQLSSCSRKKTSILICFASLLKKFENLE